VTDVHTKDHAELLGDAELESLLNKLGAVRARLTAATGAAEKDAIEKDIDALVRQIIVFAAGDQLDLWLPRIYAHKVNLETRYWKLRLGAKRNDEIAAALDRFHRTQPQRVASQTVAKTEPMFDPVAVGEKIRSHLEKADKAKATQLEHAKAAGVLLLDAKENHPEHYGAICERLDLGHSRIGELLMIASGKRTQEETKTRTRARINKHRAKKRAIPPAKPKCDPLQPDVTDGSDVVPDASAMRGAQAAAEPQPEGPRPTAVNPTSKGRPGRSVVQSDQALAEFKLAARHSLPDMNTDDRRRAIDFVKETIEHLNRGVAA
jgi:hypothetical protein